LHLQRLLVHLLIDILRDAGTTVLPCCRGWSSSWTCTYYLGLLDLILERRDLESLCP